MHRSLQRSLHRHTARAALGASLLALTFAPAAGAQDSETELRQEIEALKKGQQQIQRQLLEITKLLKSRPSAPSGPQVNGVMFNLGENEIQGKRTAQITLVEFTDYQ